MSDFFNPCEARKAKKAHQCSYCGESIEIGDTYTFQKGNWDGAWFESKIHPECFDYMCKDGDREYEPYSGDRPERKATGEQA